MDNRKDNSGGLPGEEEDVSFHGFSDTDSVKSSVQAKLARMRQIQFESKPKSEELKVPGSLIQNKRPMNRFLKRSSESPSPVPPAVKIPLSSGSPVDKKSSTENKPCSEPPPPPPVVQKTLVKLQQNLTPAKKDTTNRSVPVASSSSSLAAPKPQPNGNPEPPPPPTTSTTEAIATPTPPRARRQSKATPKALEHQAQKLNAKKRARESDPKPDSSAIVAMMEAAALAVTENQEDQVAPTLVANNIAQNQSKHPNGQGDTTGHIPSHPEMPSLVMNNNQPVKRVLASSKSAPSPDIIVGAPKSKRPTVPSVPKEEKSKVSQPAPPQQPSPAKRSASISEFSFLPGQSSRSKRTIVPNKRFISVDSPPHTPNGSEVAQKQPATKSPKKSVPSAVSTSTSKAPPPAATPPNKKRTVSGDSAKTTGKSNKKRKLSVEAPVTPTPQPLTPAPLPPLTNGGAPTSADAAGTDASNIARPRRTIIPNRKFLDDEEIAKEPVVKKTVEDVELKRKRRKSEKSGAVARNNSSDGLPLLPPPPPVHIPVASKSSPIQNHGTSPAKEKVKSSGAKPTVPVSVIPTQIPDLPPPKQPVSVVAPAPLPVLNGTNGPSNTKPEVNVAAKSFPVPIAQPNQSLAKSLMQAMMAPRQEPEVKTDDEIPIGEEEKALFGKPIFLGTCILRSGAQRKDQEKSQGGIICCGVCTRVKKYSLLNDKRKRGAYLCTHCAGIVTQIFAMALKAKPFSCIIGPPVCTGDCPLVFNSSDQFCQACFAKTCLRNLPMKDDVYFKVWRSIPPMSRGGVPTSPVVNKASPHVGKLAFVNDEGEIISTTASLKMFTGAKKQASGDVPSEDSNSSNEVVINGNGEGDLNSARITTFSHRSGTPTNRENTIPLKNSTVESQLSSVTSCSSSSSAPVIDHLRETLKPNGVMKEELIYCSLCCEPFHPYCAGDDLLLDTYIARCNDQEEIEGGGGLALKWTCRRCLSCKSCGDCIGRSEMIRCNRCQNAYHLDSCIDKQILAKVKDRRKLRKVWSCDDCMKCKSCGKRIESNRRVKTIQEVAAATEDSSESEEEEDEDMKGEEITSSNQVNCLMLCLDCFKQRKKGSYCPLCEVCYDDNDWDSKMMECVKCNRWIHSTCENLSDDQYHILGTLPEYIEYSCRLCRASSSVPLWHDAIQSLLIKQCNSAVRLFEQKCLGSMRRKRSSSTDQMKPSFVCNLFGDSSASDNNIVIDVIAEEEITENSPVAEKEEEKVEITLKLVEDEEELNQRQRQEEQRLFRKDFVRSVSYREMIGCRVILRDFVKHPANLQENWYALKVLGVEVLSDWSENYMKGEKCSKRPTTPVHPTPKKIVFTPSKRISGITSGLMKNVVGPSLTSVRSFQKAVISGIEENCENEEEKRTLLEHARSALQETFPWFDQSSSEIESSSQDEMGNGSSAVVKKEETEKDTGNQFELTKDPFEEMYWDPMDFFDDRICSLCGEVGDFPPELCGRLLWCGGSEWIHCNCAIWSSEVYELESGALQQVGGALNRGKMLRCKVCGQKGATVSCCHSTCKNSYHFQCAIEAGCFLLENKTMFCSHHKLTPKQLDDIQEDMKVGRKVFVDLEWIQKRGIKIFSDDTKVFIGSLKVDRLGSIVPISVASMELSEFPPSTLLTPVEFHSQRIFWSMTDPWRKDCYSFRTTISSNGFPYEKVHDAGVNLVVDHTRKSESISRGMEAVQKFHEWARKAPRYIDEELVEWMPSCSEDFQISDDDSESGIESLEGMRMIRGRSSPSSVSSMGSFNHVPSGGPTRRSPYPLRGRPVELTDAEGYASSVESLLSETPKSVRPTRQVKRRRSSCRTGSSRKTPRKRIKLDEKLESPRRRSMRNLHLKETASNWELSIYQHHQQKEEPESDNDSGMIESGSSTAGMGDEDRIRCKVNLLAQFNASFEEEQALDNLSLISPKEEEAGVSLLSENDDSDAKLYAASIQFKVEKNHSTLYESCDARDAWMFLFEGVCRTRRNEKLKELVHPTLPNKNLCGSYLETANSFRMMGISHRSVQYLLEQLPGVFCVLNRHKFRYSHRPYVDPNDEKALVEQNARGSARVEGFKGRKPFDMFGWLASRHRRVPMTCQTSEDSSRSQGLPLAMQFRDLKVKARKRFVVSHSGIHGRGLFAQVDVEKGEMLIEYAGEVIRPSLSDFREKYYESRGIGCYMFRIKTQVIDATMKGNAARFINHSCEPNCEAKTVRILSHDHIIIFALRKIFKGEELTYDYKFEREEDKIPCSCGASRCRKYMN